MCVLLYILYIRIVHVIIFSMLNFFCADPQNILLYIIDCNIQCTYQPLYSVRSVCVCVCVCAVPLLVQYRDIVLYFNTTKRKITLKCNIMQSFFADEFAVF